MKSRITNLLEALDRFNIISVSDLQDNIKYANDNFCKISGYKREELLGKSQAMFNSKHHSQNFWKELWETVQNAEIWQGEIRNQNKLGSYYWVFTTIVPIIDKDGKPQEYFTLCIDITEKKEKEVELLRNRHNLRAIFNTSGVASYLLKRNYEIVDANLAAQSEVKEFWNKEILVGENILEYITQEHIEKFRTHYHKAFLGEEIQYETEVKYGNKSVWYDIAYKPIQDSNQEVYAVLYNRHNISDKKRRLDKINRQNEILKEIAEISSHNIRGPVASLLGLLQLFDRTEINKPLNQDLMNHMDTMTQKLDQVIHEIVEMTYEIDE